MSDKLQFVAATRHVKAYRTSSWRHYSIRRYLETPSSETA